MPCDTCFSECPMFKKRERCHNHVVTAWKNDQGETMLVHDCAPRRSLQCHLQMEAQLLATRQEISQLQHSTAELAKAVALFVSVANRTKEAMPEEANEAVEPLLE